MNCPQCKRGDVVERLNKKTGQTFYGCTRYPDCRFAVADLASLAPSSLSRATALAGTDLRQSSNHEASTDLVSVSAIRQLSQAITAFAKQFEPTSSSESKAPADRDRSDFPSSISGDAQQA